MEKLMAVRKIEEDRQLLREQEETRQRLDRRAEAMRQRWIAMMRIEDTPVNLSGPSVKE
jgi:hypothetical protein